MRTAFKISIYNKNHDYVWDELFTGNTADDYVWKSENMAECMLRYSFGRGPSRYYLYCASLV
jgi:hypothetical protein